MPLAAFPKCYLDSLIVHKTMSVEQWVDLAIKELDVDGLEFYMNFTPVEDPARMKKLREKVEAHGWSIPMMCYSPDFTMPDLADRKKEIEKEKKAIEATAALGGKYCRVLSGQRRDTITRQQGVQWSSECIQACIPHAREYGVTLIIENHYKDGYWQFPEFAQKMDVFLELLNSIPPDPNFGVNYDPSNTIIAGEDPIELLKAVKQRVVSMHASDRYFEGGTVEDLRKMEAHPSKGYAPILKHGVIGRGLNDYDQIFSILKSVNFKGWISIEDGEDPKVGMDHLRESAVFLRKKMKQHGLV